MLTACLTIVKQAIENKTFLISKRAGWADPFLPDLQKRIENALTNFLGVDSAQPLREATRIVMGIQKKAISDLTDLKTQIAEDFKKNKARRDELLTHLGITSNWKDVQNRNQQALIELLLTLNKNMTADLQKEITQAGTSPELITSIKGYGEALSASNVTQEMLKNSRKSVSAATTKEFNEIYEASISVAKIATRLYKDKPAEKAKFSYRQTVKAQSAQSSRKNQTPAAGSATAPPASKSS
jgi:hypothetical protein